MKNKNGKQPVNNRITVPSFLEDGSATELMEDEDEDDESQYQSFLKFWDEG